MAPPVLEFWDEALKDRCEKSPESGTGHVAAALDMADPRLLARWFWKQQS